MRDVLQSQFGDVVYQCQISPSFYIQPIEDLVCSSPKPVFRFGLCELVSQAFPSAKGSHNEAFTVGSGSPYFWNVIFTYRPLQWGPLAPPSPHEPNLSTVSLKLRNNSPDPGRAHTLPSPNILKPYRPPPVVRSPLRPHSHKAPCPPLSNAASA